MRRSRLFWYWLIAFYGCWISLVFFLNLWPVVQAHWPIALSMAFGSYIAGSTPMGGGTVGFPVLVLFFGLPGSLGRNFALAVQSIGMVSASIYIVSKGRPVEWRILRPTMVGSLVGTPAGAIFIAPLIPDLWVKLVFAVVWCSFGIMHIFKLNELIEARGENERFTRWCLPIGFFTGLAGGIVSSITGVGIDMMLYATLVLLFQADLKISIPTSVIIMAFTSLLGIATNWLLAQLQPNRYIIDPEVFGNWIAAAPVVAVGAPFGAYVVELISRRPTLILVSLLCVVQFVWMLYSERVSGWVLVCAVAAVILVNGLFHVLYRWGRGEQILSGKTT
ncbi:MAG: sulfite exporter TauE/SafE family protein [Planctomycetales bacterium]|nr:sulfite exporter TauE/SafE family protein [Planctomycetales bacterium]